MRGTQAGNFIRGGQTTQHWFRMFVQVLRYAITVAATAFLIVSIYVIGKDFTISKFTLSRQWFLADINVRRGKGDMTFSAIQPDGSRRVMTYAQAYSAPAFKGSYDALEREARRAMWLGGYAAIGSGLISFLIFLAAGQRLGVNRHLRGAMLVGPHELAAYSKERWKEAARQDKRFKTQPRYSIAGIPFPPAALQAQTLICGTTGVGKTTLIKELLTSIRKAGGSAIIYDRSGDYTATFYDETRDIILNPFDARSHCWSPFNDANTAESFAKLYDVLIPSRPDEKDKFWPQAARIVAEHVSRELLKRGEGTNAALRNAIMSLPIEAVEELVAGTAADKFMGEAAGKMGTSVYATMLAELRFLEFLRDDGPRFSARDWVNTTVSGQTVSVDPDTGEVLESAPKSGDGGSFLFLTGHPEFDTATRNITSAVMEIAATALMAGQKSFEPKLFFIIDELPTLNRLPFLVGKLAEVRNVGGCFVLGIQVLSQLESVYGRADARTILGNLNNTFIGSTPDKETATLLSDALGKIDQIETQENLSFGATEVRDGASFNATRAERAIITATEIMKLPQFRVYATFAYSCPTALLTFKRQKDIQISEPLLPYTGSGFGHDTLDPEAFKARAAFLALDQAAQAGEFLAWLTDYQKRQSINDPNVAFTDADKRALWAHFALSRLKGLGTDVIGPPMMGDVDDGKGFAHPRDPVHYIKPGSEDLADLTDAMRIVIAGSSDYEENEAIWAALDKARLGAPDAVLCHTGFKGAATIAHAWATARRVPQHIFAPKFDLHGHKAPLFANSEMLEGSIAALLLFGDDDVLRHLSGAAQRRNITATYTAAPRTKASVPPYPISEPKSEPARTAGADPGPAPSDRPSPTASGGADQQDPPEDPQPDLFEPRHTPCAQKETQQLAEDLLTGEERPRDLMGANRARSEGSGEGPPLSQRARAKKPNRPARRFGA